MVDGSEPLRLERIVSMMSPDVSRSAPELSASWGEIKLIYFSNPSTCLAKAVLLSTFIFLKALHREREETFWPPQVVNINLFINP